MAVSQEPGWKAPTNEMAPGAAPDHGDGTVWPYVWSASLRWIVPQELPAFPSQELHTKICACLKTSQQTIPWRAREEVPWDMDTEVQKGCLYLFHHGLRQVWLGPWLVPTVAWEWLLSPVLPCLFPEQGLQNTPVQWHPCCWSCCEATCLQSLWTKGCFWFAIPGSGRDWLWGSHRIIPGTSPTCPCVQHHLFLTLSWQLGDLKVIRYLTWTGFQGSRAPAFVQILQKHVSECSGKVKLCYCTQRASIPSPGISRFMQGTFVFLFPCLNLLCLAKCLLLRLLSL